MTATERGRKNGSSEARTATWSRSATCSHTRRWARSGTGSRPRRLRRRARPRSRRRGRRGACVVVVEYLGDELLDPGLGGPGGQPLEQAHADPAPLEFVVHGERDLGGARVAQPDQFARPRSGRRATRAARRAPASRLEQRLDEPRSERGEAVEAEVAAAIGEAGEELEQRVGILRGGRSQPERRAVAEDDVGRLDGRHAHAAAPARRSEARPDDEHRAGAEWTSPVETLPERNRRAAPQPWEPTMISCASYSLAFRQISSTASPFTATVRASIPSASAASATDASSASMRWCSASASSETTSAYP